MRGILRMVYYGDEGHKTHITVFIKKCLPMSLVGSLEWSKQLRPTLKRYVHKPVACYSKKKGNPMPVSVIDTKEKIKSFFEDHFGNGTWEMYTVTSKKHYDKQKHKIKYISSWKRKVFIDVRQVGNDRYISRFRSCKMGSYWFWKS